jgi:hydroxyacylglutathione hydrolase
MYFKQILNEEGGCSSYVIASRQTGDAVVVDPALDIEPYLQLASGRGFTYRLAIDTHLHADHVSGLRKLAVETGAAVVMHESADVLFPFRGLHDGEKIMLGQLVLEILHTPGHRPEGISILVTNPPRGEEPSLVLTGDSLFVGDVGRPDFGGAEGARQQYESVHRLLNLDDYLEVFPAHFEGSCGKGMCGRPSTTIGFERRFNPMLQMTREEFIEDCSRAPAKPLNMTAIIETNRGEADYAWSQPRTVADIDIISVEAAASRIANTKPVVIDVREPEEYSAAHLPDAISIPQSDIASRLGELGKDREYLVVCAGGVRSLRAAQYLKWMGFSNVASIGGGTDEWIASGREIESDFAAPHFESARPGRPERYMHATS